MINKIPSEKSELTVILVDDEEASIDILENLLFQSSFDVQLKIVAKCANLVEAVTFIKRLSPDIVFLDIQMPEYAGYQIVDFFAEINFKIIFTTAYDNYAIKAFEINASDYLLKPFNRNRLKEAVLKVVSEVNTDVKIRDYKRLLKYIESQNQKLILSELGGNTVLNLNEIIAFEAKGSYCLIHLKDRESILASRNLKYFNEQVINSSIFFRTHKAWLLNLNYVEELDTLNNQVLMSENIIAKLAKVKKSFFLEALNKKAPKRGL